MKADLKASISISTEQQKLIEEFIGAVKDFQEAVNRLTTISTAIDKIEVGLDAKFQEQPIEKADVEGIIAHIEKSISQALDNSNLEKKQSTMNKEMIDILMEQMKILSDLNKTLNPEQIWENTLAIVEIAKVLNSCPEIREFDRLPE